MCFSVLFQRCCGTPQGLSSGIVYLYRQDSSGKFVLSQRLTANASAVTGFGASMALAADGSILLGDPWILPRFCPDFVYMTCGSGMTIHSHGDPLARCICCAWNPQVRMTA